MSLPAAKHKTLHVEPDDGQTKSWASIGTFDTIAQPMRYEKSLRILQWHQKSPAIFARRRKSIPCLIFYKYVLCTFIHQKVRHDFGSIDLDHKPQEAKQAPRRDPSPWYCIRIMLTVTARYMIRSLQRHSGLFKQQGLGIEVGLLLGSLYIAGLYNCLTA